MKSVGIFITILVYYLSLRIFEKSGRKFFLNPVLLSITVIAIILYLTGISYNTYMDSAGIISYLLNPTVVALSIPLYKERKTIAEYWVEISSGVVIGGLIAILSSVFIAHLCGAQDNIIRSIAPKSITTAIAIGVSEKIGGIPPLTAVLVVVTGIMGNAVGVELMNLLRIRDRVARGLGMGVTSHGLGTARIIMDDELSGAISGLAMALNGIFTSFVLPYIIIFIVK